MKRWLFLLPLFFLAVPASAAEIYFGGPADKLGVGSEVEVGVFLNSDGQPVNAVEGDISLPAGAEVNELLDAGSIVSLWVEQPAVTQGSNAVHFSGIIPGGLTVTRGLLFSLVVTLTEPGSAIFSSTNEQILLNDGQGTAAKLREAPLTLTVTATGSQPTFLLPTDTDPPEPFTPVVAQDPNIFDGKWFVSFAAQDKISGIDHYELSEQPPATSVFAWILAPSWRTVQSPAELQDQSLTSRIVIKAFDRSGNERDAEVAPMKPLGWYETKTFWGIIVVIIALGAVFTFRRIWRKRTPR